MTLDRLREELQRVYVIPLDEPPPLNSAREPQLQHRRLPRAAFRRQLLVLAPRRAARRDGLDVRRRVGDVLVPHLVDEPRRRRPEPDVRLVVPVPQVVPAFRTRAGKVADLVVCQARRGQHIERQLVHVRLQVGIDRRHQPRITPPTQRRVRLIREPIRGDVLSLERERRFQATSPRCERLPGNAEDQVQADPPHPKPPARRHRLADLLRPMAALQHA